MSFLMLSCTFKMQLSVTPSNLLVVLCVAIGGLLVEAASIKRSDSAKTYGVIVDCGSSGTRAHIFEWDDRLKYPELLHDIAPMRDANGSPITMKITPGLSSLDDNPDGASDYMQPIVDFILSNLPKGGERSAGVYILGTAGMRLLSEQTQKKIMADIAVHLLTKHNFAKVKTKVISGADEGMYQWITVNSKLQRFINDKHPKNGSVQANTYGVLEMGGASTQIAFQLKPGMQEYLEKLMGDDEDAKLAFRDQITEPHISRETKEHSYKLISTTFLGLGSNSAREAHVDLLVMDHHARLGRSARRLRLQKSTRSYLSYTEENPLQIVDPCLPEGAEEVMLRPIKMFHTKGKTCGYNVDDDDQVFHVKLVGAGKYQECHSKLLQMLSTAKRERMNCEPDGPCTMSLLGTPFVPHFSFELLGLSEFYYTANEMLNEAGEFSWAKFTAKNKDICNSNYQDLQRKYPDADRYDTTRILLECFKATFMETFLTFGLRIPKDYELFSTVNQIKGDKVDWTLGAVLDNSLAIEAATELMHGKN